MPTTVTLTGWKEFEAKCVNLPKVLFDEIDGEVEDSARLWAAGAKRDAPNDQGFLSGRISSRKIGLMVSEAFSEADYSAYVEWGTKSRAKVPADLQQYASQFKGGGAGAGGAKKMIFAWMERVGIPKERQWITFLSIIIKGIRPHPFFFIQTPLVQAQLNKNVQTILNTEH